MLFIETHEITKTIEDYYSVCELAIRGGGKEKEISGGWELVMEKEELILPLLNPLLIRRRTKQREQMRREETSLKL